MIPCAAPLLAEVRSGGFRPLGGRGPAKPFVPFWAALALLTCFAGNIRGAEPSKPQFEFFETKIRPVLVANCYECHTAAALAAKKLKGELLLDSRDGSLQGGASGPAVVPGKPDESLLISALRHEAFEMPPRGKLADNVIADFVKWIETGAADPREAAPATAVAGAHVAVGREFWSFQPLRKPAIPAMTGAGSSGDGSARDLSPIDRFIQAKLAEKKLSPATEADRRTLIRRLYFDLVGLPPEPEAIEAFLADASPNAYERLVERLLASPHFGEHWGRHWLDVARFAESSGGGRTLLYNDAWRYRDYVIGAFNDDLPFNEFIVEQIAGDLLPTESLDLRRRRTVATAFLALGPTNYELQDKDILDMDVIDEQIDTIGRAFLGMTLGCARCHDHKFDPIPTADYYALAGIFKSTQTLIHDNVSAWVNVPLPMTSQREAELAAHQQQLGALDEKIKVAKASLASLNATTAVASSAPGTPLPLDKLPGIVVDDARAKQVGRWQHSQYSKSYIGDGYLHDVDQEKGKKSLTFVPELKAEGRYEVRLAYTPGGNRATNVPVTVFHADGEKTVTVNQKQAPPLDGRLMSLGQFRFELNGQGFVIVANEGTDGHVIADAVQFLAVADGATADNDPTQQASADGTAKSSPEKPGPMKEEEAKRTVDELKQLEAERKQLVAAGPQRDLAMAVKERAITDCRICIRGSLRNLGPAVPRGFLTVASTVPAAPLPANASGRKELGAWIASDRNPLTARVTANRVWHWLFGTGLVRTVDNFGSMGERPSHPELLDYLAARFIDEGWSVKRLVREIVLSQTYRQASAPRPELANIDPENRLLARMPRRRLPAEAIRDAMHAVGGELDLRLAGSNIKPGTTIEYGYAFTDRRRSVYTPVFRNTLSELMEAFDFADPNQVVGRRNITTGAAQALLLMNSPAVIEKSRRAAARLLAEAPSDLARIDRLYLAALGRPPTAAEQGIALKHLSTHANEATAWPLLVQAVFASVDFRYLD